MNMESNNIPQSRKKGSFLGEKGPIIWQSRFTLVVTSSLLCKGATV